MSGSEKQDADRLAAERSRLQLLEQMLDPLTQQHLGDLGLAPGWRCLEAGSGAGSIARWLAMRVGSTGRVVAADIEPGLSGASGLPQLEVRRHDIQQDAPEPEAYNLAHCRALAGDARGQRFSELTRRINTSLPAWGVLDMYVGQRLAEYLAAAGLTHLKVEQTLSERGGGDAASRFQRATLVLLAPLIGAGVITSADREFLGECFSGPGFRYQNYSLAAARGQRAAAG
ncbi:MAG: hypothetical protein ACYC6L_01565 [Anaerolineae bacterium]